jgi:hypothetical protein
MLENIKCLAHNTVGGGLAGILSSAVCAGPKVYITCVRQPNVAFVAGSVSRYWHHVLTNPETTTCLDNSVSKVVLFGACLGGAIGLVAGFMELSFRESQQPNPRFTGLAMGPMLLVASVGYMAVAHLISGHLFSQTVYSP